MNGTKKSILIVVPFAFHRESGSSLSTYYRVLAISELVDHIDIITTPHGRNLTSEKITIHRIPKKAIFKTYQPGEFKKRLVYELFLLIKTVQLLFSRKYSFVIIHGSSIYWAFILQKCFSTPFVATIHGNIQVELEKWNISSNLKAKSIAARIENRIIRSFHHIIAEHNTVKDILISSGIACEKVSLIRIGVVSVPPVRVPLLDSYFIILYTGTFVKVQNLELLYKTMQLLRDLKVRLILIGGIANELKEEQFKIDSYRISESVILKQRINQIELLDFYETAHLVVSPREFGHDTPMKIFDYMNFGKCILATDRPIHTGILTHECACLVDPSPEAFASKIIELINSPEILIEKGIKAKQFFEGNFELKKMIENYREVIEKIG